MNNRQPSLLPLSVVVCTFNRCEILEKCISALLYQSLPCENYEIIVVDNRSTDGTNLLVRGFQKINCNLKYFMEEMPGLSFARNRGWREAQGEFIAYIDDDAIAEFDWAQGIYDTFRSVQPPPDAVGGKILPWYIAPIPGWFDDTLEVRTWGDYPRFMSRKNRRDCYGFSGSNMAFNRQAIRELGGFKEDLGMNGEGMRFGEDSDLFLRMINSGKKLFYNPRCIVRHAVDVRHYDFRYIAQRAYRSGISHAAIDSNSGQKEGRGRIILDIIASLFHFPFYILREKGSYRLKTAKKLRRVFHLFGYLVGS